MVTNNAWSRMVNDSDYGWLHDDSERLIMDARYGLMMVDSGNWWSSDGSLLGDLTGIYWSMSQPFQIIYSDNNKEC